MPRVTGSAIDEALADVLEEAIRAQNIHGGMASPHEGYAIILEELDELWDHVKADTARTEDARKEAIQVAASAMRFAATFSA